MASDEDPKLKSLLEIWKVCVDLHKFHDNLKQDRARRFTTVQIALAAGFGISIRNFESSDLLNASLLQVVLILGIIIGGALYAHQMITLDSRASEYVKVVKNQIRGIENEIAREGITSPTLLPYEGQYRVINLGTYVILEDASYRAFPVITRKRKPRTAHMAEQLILRAVLCGWLAAFICTLVVGAEKCH